MDENCIFCRIIAGKIPGDIVYQDDKVVAFRDREPKAPTHILVVTREHIPSLRQLGPQHRELVAHLIYVGNEIAKKEGVDKRGYRLTVNCGREGGQAVPHVHFHLLGGRQMSGSMG